MSIETSILEALEPQLERIADEAVRRVLAQVESYRRAGPAMTDALRRAFLSCARASLEELRSDSPQLRVDVDPLVRACLPEIDSGVLLEDMLRVVHIAADVARTSFTETFARAPQPAARRLLRRTLKLDRIRDLINAGITRRYLENDRRWLQRREDVERELIGSLTSDEPNPAAAARAAGILGLSLEDRSWTVFVATRDDAIPLDRLRADLCRKGEAMLSHANGHLVGVVEGGLSEAAPVEGSIGIGGEHRGAAGIRTSFDEALQALEIARRRGCGAVRYADAPLDRLLLGHTTPGELVETVLMPLARLSERKRRAWMETLEAYLDAATSITATAQRLGQHPQSVRYRIERLRSLLSPHLDRAESRLALHVALKAERLGFGLEARHTP